jgi:hypothetical protein
MKRRILVVTWIVIGVVCTPAYAQDLNRVPDINKDVNAVDASVQAVVGDPSKQRTQPSQDPSKNQAPYSRWAFHPENQPPATQFSPTRATTLIPSGPADGKNPSTLNSPSFRPEIQTPVSTDWHIRATDHAIASGNDGNPGKLEWRSILFHSLDIGRTEDRSTGPQSFKTEVPLLFPQSQTDGFSAPFRAVQFGIANTSSLSHSYPKTIFPSKRVTANQHKRFLHRQLAYSDLSRPNSRYSNDQRKLAGSRLVAKAKSNDR